MATHHVRHQSHPSKKSQPAHARPSRPLTKRAHSLGSKAAAAAAASKSAPYPKPDDDNNNNNINDDDDSMAVSFLNYCTVCEKQIIVPSNSVLYCSESCKKKDSEKSLTYSFDHYSPPTTPFTNFSFDDFAFRDIVPQRSPTQPESKRSSCAFSDMSSDDNSSEHYVRSNSEASNYLRKFQSSIYSSEAAARPYRPRYQRSSTSQFSFSAAPSLSHTPASSVSYSLPYTPATTRPLPPRTKPSHSSSYGAKSIDLVTPVTAPSSPNNSSPKKSYSHKSSPAMSSTSTSTIEGEIVYAKSPVPEPSFASGSLGRLLASTPR